jgi:cobalamin biosynthesis protein CbiG
LPNLSLRKKKPETVETSDHVETDASVWSVQEASDWAKQVSAFTAAKFKERGVTGAMLVKLSGSELNEFVEVIGLFVF